MTPLFKMHERHSKNLGGRLGNEEGKKGKAASGKAKS
jgi:hypothetical protein